MSTDLDLAVVISEIEDVCDVRHREDNDDSFGGATAVLPGWHGASVRQGGDDAAQHDCCFGLP
jgi:hypothetical protein